jgi:hypothetical protein
MTSPLNVRACDAEKKQEEKQAEVSPSKMRPTEPCQGVSCGSGQERGQEREGTQLASEEPDSINYTTCEIVCLGSAVTEADGDALKLTTLAALLSRDEITQPERMPNGETRGSEGRNFNT